MIVNESSGQPGSGKSILIRGISTNGDNSPLYVVDGLQVGNIDNLNPSDVESVDVLKDAASSAIYGARAANGVVIITTKNGSKGAAASPIPTATSTQTLGSFPRCSARGLRRLDAGEVCQQQPNLGLDILGFPDFGDAIEGNTNWMEAIFNPAQVINHRVTASGENSYMSMDYWDQNGVIGGEKSNYTRYALRYNSTKKVQDLSDHRSELLLEPDAEQQHRNEQCLWRRSIRCLCLRPPDPHLRRGRAIRLCPIALGAKGIHQPLEPLYSGGGDNKSDQILGNVFLEAEP